MQDYPQHQESRISASAFLTVHDPEDQYDVFLFWPSSQPYVVLPGGSLSAAGNTWAHDSRESFDLQTCESFPPLSPSYSFASEFAFPNPYDEGITKLGYSDFFKQGLLSQSYRITRRFDRVVHSIRRSIRSTKRRLSN